MHRLADGCRVIGFSRNLLHCRHISQQCMSLSTYKGINQRITSVENLRTSFSDGQTAFAGKSYTDLLRSYLVLRLCSFNIFAENSYKIFTVLRGILGKQLFSILFKPTVYRNFIAGQKKTEILTTASSLSRSGLMPLISPMLEDSPDGAGFNEQTYQRNKEVIRESIEICSSVEYKRGPNCLAIKLSALIPAQTLADLTKAIGFSERITEAQVLDLSKAFDTVHPRSITSLELTTEEQARLRKSIPNLLWLGEECTKKRVNVYIDAEFTQFQPGVRLVTLTLVNLFNRNQNTFWNTYQCYLKKTEQQVEEDTKLIDSLGARWGGKIVRGAYIQYERKKAQDLGVQDPVHETFDDTSAAYNRTAAYLLRGVEQGKQWRCILATHNEESVLEACKLYTNLGIQDGVYLGQIAGMGDGISGGLARAGFSVYKLVPTGSVDEVLPWLSRRMEENKGMMERSQKDRIMIFNEIRRRTFPFF